MSDDKKLKALRSTQALRVMKHIGAMLDAWEGLGNDLKSQLAEEGFDWHIEKIRKATGEQP